MEKYLALIAEIDVNIMNNLNTQLTEKQKKYECYHLEQLMNMNI